jgi:hypothetical protein
MTAFASSDNVELQVARPQAPFPAFFCNPKRHTTQFIRRCPAMGAELAELQRKVEAAPREELAPEASIHDADWRVTCRTRAAPTSPCTSSP